ncbi:hypothetical protein DER45DRAFT_543194 [Fusarium avenaceum]|nr:hypothetical protein DER45DRAFT_543194 [Fusarium avenaceum]
MRKPAWAGIKVPTGYSELGSGDTKDGLQKAYKRIFYASGLWPWDWLPHDYVPQPQHWSANAAASMAAAVEAACKPGAGVTMDDLRDFLVNQAVRYRAGNPTQPHRINKDCRSAKEWIESKRFGSSVMPDEPDEPEEDPTEMDDQSDRNTEVEQRNSPESSDEESESVLTTEHEQRENVWPVPRRARASSPSASNNDNAWPRYERGAGPASQFTDLGSISLSTHEQKELSLLSRGTTMHSRSRSFNDTTATRNQFGVVNLSARYRSNPAKPTSVIPIGGGSDIARREFDCLPAIEQDIRATDSRIDAAEKQIQRCKTDTDKENRLIDSIPTGTNQVIQMATQELDKAQEELGKAQFSANAVAKRLSGWEHYADAFTAACNEARIKRENAQKNLEAMKAETQRLECQCDQAILNIKRLQDQLEEQKMIISNEVKKKTGLFAVRNIMELLSSERIGTLALGHFEDLENYTQDLMDKAHEPRSISQARDT